MQTTTNYELKVYEGSDLFNPLTVENVNTETIDEVVKAISNKSVGTATELKTGTVHALTRVGENVDRNIFTFQATSAFTAGDTFTLDGAQVSALTVSGEQLSTGCYIIGSTVLVAKRDTLLTFFVAETTAKDAEKLGGELPRYYATANELADIADYVTALQDKVGTATLTTTAQNCSEAINEIHAIQESSSIISAQGSSMTSINHHAIKKDNIVTLECVCGGSNLPRNSWVTVGTLAVGWRPSTLKSFSYADINGIACIGRINTSGLIEVVNPNSNATGVLASATINATFTI